jgi:hypothetical protein
VSAASAKTGLELTMPGGPALAVEIWITTAFVAGGYAIQMVRGLRDAGRRALGPGVLLLLGWVMLGGVGISSMWLFYWLQTKSPGVAAFPVF